MSRPWVMSSVQSPELYQPATSVSLEGLLGWWDRVRAARAVRAATPAIGLAASAVLVTLAWWPSFPSMWLRWYPAWGFVHLNLWQRLTEIPSYYNHAPLVPCVSLVIAVRLLRKSTAGYGPSRGATATGWLLAVGSGLLQVVSVHADLGVTSGLALIGLLGGLCLLWGGWGLLRTMAAPLALLLFMVPLPMAWIAEANLDLRLLASRAAAWVLVHGLGLAVVLDGSTLHGFCADGGVRSLPIEEACSGLRNLIALLWFAGAFTAVSRCGRRWRFVLLGSALPLALMSNVVRLLLLACATWTSWSSPFLERWMHDSGGVLVFVLAMIGLTGIERVALRCQDRRAGEGGGPTRRRAGIEASTGMPATLRPSVLALLAMAGVLSWGAVAGRDAGVSGVDLSSLAPSSFASQGTAFSGLDLPTDAGTARSLAGGSCLRRVYVDLASGRRVNLLVTFAEAGRRATHPPEVCLRGRGRHILSKRHVPFSAGHDVSGEVCELLVERGAVRTLHLYVYRCGGRLEASFTRQQVDLLVASLLGRPTSGGLIQISAVVRGGDVPAARETAMAVLSEVLPRIHRRLP